MGTYLGAVARGERVPLGAGRTEATLLLCVGTGDK